MCRDAVHEKLFSGNCQVICSAWSLLRITCLSPASLPATGNCQVIWWVLHLLQLGHYSTQPVCLHPLCLHCYICAVTQCTKSLFSGNCQVTCSAWSLLHKYKHVCLHPLCLHCCARAVTQGTKNLFSGNCQVICWFAPASAWSLLHITCLSPSSFSALLHMCHDAVYEKLF